MVRSAVFTVAEALFLLKFIGANRASPGNKAWRDGNVAFQLVGVPVEFFDEIKSK